MKELMDIQVIETTRGGVFSLDKGYTGKLLLGSDNYFEGIVRDHRTVSDYSLIFGQLYENGDINFMKVAPNDERVARQVVVGTIDGVYVGQSFCKSSKFEYADCGLRVNVSKAEIIRDVEEDEVNKLSSMIKEFETKLGEEGRKFLACEYKPATPKKNVKR